MKTSYYANPKLKEGNYFLVSISVGIPKWAVPDGLFECKELAPTWDMVKKAKAGDHEYYWNKYEKQLASLNPYMVYDTIEQAAEGKEPVLLCYEKDSNQCHRKRVAEWFSSFELPVSEL